MRLAQLEEEMLELSIVWPPIVLELQYRKFQSVFSKLCEFTDEWPNIKIWVIFILVILVTLVILVILVILGWLDAVFYIPSKKLVILVIFNPQNW